MRIKLINGATANVDENCSKETIDALNQVVKNVQEKFKKNRHGNDLVSDTKNRSFHGFYTAILEFEVVNPQHDLETIGERLKLSTFGEYCPDSSLRGYALEELLIKPQHYRPKVIVQHGEIISLNYE